MEYKVIHCIGNNSSDAVLQITSDKISLVAFCNPYKALTKEKGFVLLAFLTNNIMLEEMINLPVKTNAGYFSYHITAEVIDSNMRLVCLGDINIELDTEIPKDIPKGSIISFDVMRLDVITNR